MTTFSLQNVAGYTEALTGNMREAGMRALHATAIHIVERIVTEIIPAEDPQPVDRGAYRAAWRVREITDGYVVENAVPHSVFIEKGVRGDRVRIGRKMIDALTAWVIRKGLVGGATPGKRRRTVTDSMRKEARAVAWAIATNMKKKGIFNRGGKKGLGILERAMVGADRFLVSQFIREAGK